MKKLISVLLIFLSLMTIFTPVKAAEAEPAVIKTGFDDSGSSTQWQISAAASTANLNKVACFKDSLYIAIGNSGTIRTSPDSTNWTTNTKLLVECPTDLFDIACTDESIVVVGNKGIILHSTDGLDWKIIKPLTDYCIYKVIHSKDLFIAFTYKAGEILTSKDGLNWQVSHTGAKGTVNDVIWNGKVYVTVGSNGEICTSQNGLVWQVKVIKNKPTFTKIAWNGKLFITYGTTSAETNNYGYTSGVYTATSTNGYSWKANTFSTKNLKKDSLEIYVCYCMDIIWNGKNFVIYQVEINGMGPSPESKLTTYLSTDGITFKKSNYSLGFGTDTSFLVNAGKSYFLVCNNYALPGYYYGPTIYTSVDGMKWEMAANQYNENYCIKDIIYNNGRFILVGESGLIQSSTDGVNWIAAIDINHSPYLWNGENYISIDGQYIYTSKDGLNWEKKSKIKDEMLVGHLNWTGKEYTVFDPASFSTTSDLINWETTKLDYESQVYKDIGQLNAFSTDGNKYIISGMNGTAISTDRLTWTSKKMPNAYNEIIIGSNSYIAKNSNGNIDFSTDGLSWKRIHIKDYSGTFIKVIFENGQYIVVGTDGTVFQSSDGKNWIKVADGVVNKTFFSVLWTGSRFIAYDFNTVYTLKLGTEWQQETLPNDLYNISNISVFSNDKKIFVSGQGITLCKDLK